MRVAFDVWLLSFSVVFLEFIHDVACKCSTPFYLSSDIPLYGYSTCCLSGDGSLGCFHLLAIVANAAVNTRLQVFEWQVLVPLRVYPRPESLSHRVTLCPLCPAFEGLPDQCPHLPRHWTLLPAVPQAPLFHNLANTCSFFKIAGTLGVSVWFRFAFL